MTKQANVTTDLLSFSVAPNSFYCWLLFLYFLFHLRRKIPETLKYYFFLGKIVLDFGKMCTRMFRRSQILYSKTLLWSDFSWYFQDRFRTFWENAKNTASFRKSLGLTKWKYEAGISKSTEIFEINWDMNFSSRHFVEQFFLRIEVSLVER